MTSLLLGYILCAKGNAGGLVIACCPKPILGRPRIAATAAASPDALAMVDDGTGATYTYEVFLQILALLYSTIKHPLKS